MRSLPLYMSITPDSSRDYSMATSAHIVSEADPTPPMISVIIPAYNSARTIERCMAALVQQATARRFEIIVVDSGRDTTCLLALRVIPETRVFHYANRLMPPRARHLGATRARGELLAFIDSDIYPDQRWIENVVRAAETGHDLVCGSIANANPHSAVSRAEQLLMFNEFLPDAPQRPSWFSLSGNMVLRRSAYERFGPFVDVRAAEDIVFSRKLLAAGGTILFYPQMQVCHDNRTHVRNYLRNQVLLGKHTAMARRLVPFADTQSYTLFVLLLPVAPLAKLTKIVLRLARWNPRNILRVVQEFPLFFTGICAYCVGLASGVVSPGPQTAELAQDSRHIALPPSISPSE